MPKIKEGFQGERAIVLPARIVGELENDDYAASLHITDIGFYPKAANHHREREEGISQSVLIYCAGGKGWYSLAGQTHEVKQNQFFILPAGQPHAYGADGKEPWSIYWIHFKGSLVTFFSSGFSTPTEIPLAGDSRIQERLDIFEQIYRTLKNGYSRDNLYYAISTLHYFLGSIKFLSSYREAGTGNESAKNIVEEAIHFMRENIDRKLTLADIAGFIKYSPSHFSALFTKTTGFSPLSYFAQLKVQQACNYLDFTDMKINQICHKIGIGDPYYFSRLFMKHMDMSPSEYRRHKKG